MLLLLDTFRPAPWLPGPHAQTIWPTICRRVPQLALRRERIELPDGDFIDLDWSSGTEGPIALILHGLGGSSDSKYARGLMIKLMQAGWRAVVMHFRGCSGEPNRLLRFYNAGDTQDLAYIVERLRLRESDTPISAIGFSLGGNVLLKWLGEIGMPSPLTAAVAISVPFQLEPAVLHMKQGFSRLYQQYLLGKLIAAYRRKFSRLAAADAPVPCSDLHQIRDLYTFDDRITAPLHGYTDARDYYTRASSRSYVAAIRTPSLIVHALDDPFMTPAVAPQAAELSSSIRFELFRNGGHVGFVGGTTPGNVDYWLDGRIMDYLDEFT